MHVAGFRSLPEHKVFLLAAGDREADRDSLRTQGETEGEHAISFVAVFQRSSVFI